MNRSTPSVLKTLKDRKCERYCKSEISLLLTSYIELIIDLELQIASLCYTKTGLTYLQEVSFYFDALRKYVSIT